MEQEFQLHILCPDKTFYEGPCVSLTAPTTDGVVGILAHHSATVLGLIPGVLRCRLPGGGTLVAAVSHGMARVEGEDVLVLTGSAERPEEIDAARARRAAERARAELLQAKSWQEYLQTQANLSRALTRMNVAEKHM